MASPIQIDPEACSAWSPPTAKRKQTRRVNNPGTPIPLEKGNPGPKESCSLVKVRSRAKPNRAGESNQASRPARERGRGKANRANLQASDPGSSPVSLNKLAIEEDRVRVRVRPTVVNRPR